MEKSIYKLHEDLVLLKIEIDRLHQKSKHPDMINHTFKVKELQSISNLIDLQKQQIKELKEEITHLAHDAAMGKAAAGDFLAGSIEKIFIGWADDYFAVTKHPWPRVKRSTMYNDCRTHLKDSGVDLSKPSNRRVIADFMVSLKQWCSLRNYQLNAHVQEGCIYPYPVDIEAGEEYITITTPYDHVETK